MAKEKRYSTTIRIKQEAINNCTLVAHRLGEPYTFNSVIEQAMLLITKDQIINNLKNQNNETPSCIEKKG
jgi:hypothetical protein